MHVVDSIPFFRLDLTGMASISIMNFIHSFIFHFLCIEINVTINKLQYQKYINVFTVNNQDRCFKSWLSCKKPKTKHIAKHINK